MKIAPSHTFSLLHNSRSTVEYATQVRSVFEEDLHRIGPGICILPEWICHSMTKAALRTQHRVVFYCVNQMKESLIPLEANWSHLIDLIIQNEKIYQNIIVLTAFPLGYIDSRIKYLYLFLKEKRFAKIHLFMDLSQSYGSYFFLDDLDHVNAIYISFNGRKLIDSGGALRIAQNGKHTTHFSSCDLQKRVSIALLEQERNWEETKSSIAKHWKENLKDLRMRLDVYNKTSMLRSSYHRTALHIPIQSSKSQLIIQDGYGQTLHPHPQKYFWPMSFAYEELRKNTLLLFPRRRSALC
ncbi:hypothetical protein [Candidatus Rhabdochlamydia sp. T3358]|uniref:hypothetical protein n=1 Tax=Candidatus Rhabdochlamydia sp. T3358 TaxID=2099795 RepID=UPI0010B7D0D9|nr:hypothetical protein [Candidatus Rhabdochlamydia sp. T3358]VHO03273.1 hypothetical protein RHT_00840 [Candidatus Rhabdochlamydia sp. T3358]